jgi:hypothetical protein
VSHWLFSKAGGPSKTAFWFSATMMTTLGLVVCITIRFLVAPSAEFDAGLSGIAVVLGLPNAILAGAYTWGKKIDKQD